MVPTKFNASLALLAGFWLSAGNLPASDMPSYNSRSRAEAYEPSYHWVATPVQNGAEILTLFGRFEESEDDDVPLVAVLRDRVPGSKPETDRLRYIWLLTYDPPRLYQRFLSAVPFFYWTWGAGSSSAAAKLPKPIADIGTPTHRVWSTMGRNLVQWTAFDPMTTPVRATSRAYRTNGSAHETLHIDEALTFLRRAPVSDDGTTLSQSELDSVVARLILTKTLLGGFVSKDRLNGIAASRDVERQESIGRNWELLRTSAERAGLLFEPLPLTDATEEYALLWFPLNHSFSAPGLSLQKTWKLLHISDPWSDNQLQNWKGYKQTRWVNENGDLLPQGSSGVNRVELVPLAVYSLTYPRAPLLMADFRHGFAAKRRELAHRGSDDLVMGVLGLSHFANWYYFAGNAMYQFVKARHGGAEDAAARLDSYSEFRVAVTLTTSIDPDLRTELQRRARSLSLNPLDADPSHEIALAHSNYDALVKAAGDQDGMPKRVDELRREELALFGEGPRTRTMAMALHYAAFGQYSRRTPRRDDNLVLLARERNLEALIQYLQKVADAGPRPEVTFPADQIQDSMTELVALLHEGTPKPFRIRALQVIARVRSETADQAIAAKSTEILSALNGQTLLPPSSAVAVQTKGQPNNSAGSSFASK